MPALFSSQRKIFALFGCLTATWLVPTFAAAQPVVGKPPTAPVPPVAPAAAQPANTTTVKAKITETAIYQTPENARVTTYVGSADGKHLACIESKDKKFAVAVDGQRSPVYEWVVGQSIGFSPDGSRFSFQTQHDGLMFINVGMVGPTWNAKEYPGVYLAGRVVFSPDGKRFAYGVQKERNGKMVMIVDGVEGSPVDEVYPFDHVFSPDGKRFAYKVRIGNQQAYFLDGAPLSLHDAVGGFVFSPDSKRYGFRAIAGADARVIIDGKPTGKYSIISAFQFSPDSARYAYVAEQAGADGKPSQKQQLILNTGSGEQAFPASDGIGAMVFSPDSQRIAITSYAAKRWSVVVDGKSGPGYEASGALIFSPDSKRVALVAGRTGQQFLVIDGKELPPADVVAFASFSPDSSKIAYYVRSDQQSYLMLDDKRISAGGFFAFSPDSKHLGHGIPTEKNDHWKLAIDGQALPGEFDRFLSTRLIWDSPTSARIMAMRETTMYLVRVELQP